MPSHQNAAYHGQTFSRAGAQRVGGQRVNDIRLVPSARSSSAGRPDQIWGQYNNYRANGVAASAIVHIALLGLAGQRHFRNSPDHSAGDSADCDPYRAFARYIHNASGEESDERRRRGRRSRCPFPLQKGHPPKAALQQITPPAIVMRNEKPRLAVEPTVVVPPTINVANNHMPTIGTSSAVVMPAAPPSNGTGSGGGIGSGSGGGVGVGHGPGIGAGSGGGIGGGVYKVGGGISAPTAVSSPDPDYTEEARRAKKQGTCVLWLIVDSTGHPRDIRVARGLGFGLDAKAIDAVKQWKFQPALKDGKPVDVQISVEVEFHLY